MTNAAFSHIRREGLNCPLTKLEWGRQEGGGGNNQRRGIPQAKPHRHTHLTSPSICWEAIYMKTVTCLPLLANEVGGTYYQHPVLPPLSELPQGILGPCSPPIC